MKKTLLFITILSGYFSLNAQNLMTQDFNALTVGNVGTSITGATPGQGGLYTFTAAGSNANFQIYNEGGAYGNALQIAGPTNATDVRYVYQDGLAAAWSTRTVGNNIIIVEYDFNTGPATTSAGTTGMRLFNAAGQTIAGFRFVPSTKVITGLARYNNAGTVGTYFFNLGASNTAITLAANTWYRIGFSFNKTTGQVTWKGDSFNAFIVGTEVGVNPNEADFLVVPSTGNTVSTLAKFDNMVIRASSTEDVLSVANFSAPTVNSVSIYPNPVKDYFNVSMNQTLKVSSIKIMDINGRLIKSVSSQFIKEGQVDVSDLSAGMYILNLETNDGIISKKIIKN
jgi:hypothetical protein